MQAQSSMFFCFFFINIFVHLFNIINVLVKIKIDKINANDTDIKINK